MMAEINVGPDALHFESGGSRIQQLRSIRTLDGTAVTFAAGRNGPGTASIRSTGDGQDLSYKAPGSTVYGPVTRCEVDQGEYRIDDGEDEDKYITVTVSTSHLSPGASAANIRLDEVYENEFAGADVTEGEASAGDVTVYSISCKNYANTILSHVKVWIRDVVAFLEISNDGVVWVDPILEDDALSLADILPGAAETLHLRRTIPAASLSISQVLSLADFSWTGG